MYTRTQRRSETLTQELRLGAGNWLRELRTRRGISQRGLAELVGTEYHTFISQLENGRGRIPPDRYLIWADALGVEPREFVRTLLSYYDPVTYGFLFDVDCGETFTECPGPRSGACRFKQNRSSELGHLSVVNCPRA